MLITLLSILRPPESLFYSRCGFYLDSSKTVLFCLPINFPDKILNLSLENKNPQSSAGCILI
jgi:hypothetical protein